MKLASKWVFIGVMTLALGLAACGGGGGGSTIASTGTGTGAGTGTGTGITTTTVVLTGNLSAAAAKPSSGKSAQLYAVSSWAGATLQVIDSAGTVVGTGTVNADGTYSVDVPTGSNYFIKVQIGNLVLKAFVPSVTAAAAVNVNTTTTAEVIILASVLGVANAGEPSVNTATAIAAVNMTTVMADIEANASLSTVAASLATEIATSYDATGTTPAIGSASTTVSGTVTTIAGTVSVSATTAAPLAPTGIGVTGGNGQATVSWAAVTGATSYNVYRGTSTGVTTANGTKTTGATSGSAITGLVNGTAYYFVVTAVNAGGESAVSSEVGATPQVPAPGVPSGVGITAGNGQATVSWTAVTGATSYNVYRGTSAGVTIANGTKTTGATSGGAITGLGNGTTYYFVVTAVNAGGESAVSSQVSAMPQVPAPDAPTGVTVTGGDAQVTVSWTAAASATSYNVYHKTSTGVTIANGTKVTGVTSGGAITGLANGTTYYFVVTAVNPGGESAVSSEVWATPQVLAPGTPTGVTVAAGAWEATVSWAAVTGATSYNLYYSTNVVAPIANWNKVFGALSGVPMGLSIGTAYYFVVTAENAGGESAVSSVVSATPFALMGGAAQKLLSLTGTVATHAGGAGTLGATDATGTSARFSLPFGITTDGTNLYVADSDNSTIRKVVISTGVVTTLAGTALTVGSTDGTGSGALFNLPYGITTDGTNLYVADSTNCTIRKIVISTGVVTTLAGTALTLGSTDGTGAAARFSYPSGITTDGLNLYVADTYNHTIRKVVISTGAVTTLAGSAGFTGTTDATGTAARFNRPYGITTDGTNLYVSDAWNHTIRKIVISSGVVTTLAGSVLTSGSLDGTGSGAWFNYPFGITSDGTNLYVADVNNHTIRKVVISTGVVTTLAGGAGITGTTDATGTSARFNHPYGITADGTSLYVSDAWSHTIRKIQ